jgi:hypothetical protein
VSVMVLAEDRRRLGLPEARFIMSIHKLQGRLVTAAADKRTSECQLPDRAMWYNKNRN